jgi:hypothetical protein
MPKVLTKQEQCFPFFDVDPFPNSKTIVKISEQVGCIPRTVYRAYEKYRLAHPEIYEEDAGTMVKGKTVADSKTKQEYEKKKAEADKFLTIPSKVGFFKFAAKFSFPFYPGLYMWQKFAHQFLWKCDKKFLELLVPRDHGKSIWLNNLFQWLMDPDGGDEQWDILYLGWTDQRKKVAELVYQYFQIRGILKKGKNVSEYHFQLEDGCRFDTYLITAKDTLGLHSIGSFGRIIDEENEVLKKYIRSEDGRKLLICIDDPIDITFMDERHKEEKLERQFDSTIYNINPDRFLFVGTKKFEGDFFDFIENKFGDKLKSFRRTPLDTPSLLSGRIVADDEKDIITYEPELVNPDNTEGIIEPDGVLAESFAILCPERFTHPDLASYKADIKAKKKDLSDIRSDIGEYMWSAEYCQNPHPVTGEVWDKVEFTKVQKAWTHYDILVISLDRATTINPTSSYTGYTVMLREKETGERLVINDFTGLWEFEDLLEDLNEFICDFHSIYKNIDIYLVLEKQGGGDDFYSSAKGRGFAFLDKATVILVHNSKNKTERIKNYLYAPIKNGRLRFIASLKHSELVKEILQFPHGLRVDGVDALANAEHEIDIAEQIPPIGIVDLAALDELSIGLQRMAYGLRSEKEIQADEFGIMKKDNYNNKTGLYL